MHSSFLHRALAVLLGGCALSPGIGHAQQSSIGVNLAGDWLWADAMRQGRPHWDTAAHLGDAACTEDSNNWPTEDCSLVVWEGHAFNEGTYALSFNGKASIAVSYGYGTVNGSTSSTGTYNSTSNTTTATVVITDTSTENLSLIFTNTQRTAASSTNTGITNVHFMRPVSEGATTSYPTGTLFTNQTLALTADFSVTRFMDLVNANNSTQVNWTDRNPPGAWNQAPIAYEYVVAYGNASNRDIYINIPLYATSDYITKLAQLIKYGSTGVNPYTSAQTNPVYAPLNSNLHVYLEFSNEVWNGGFQQFHQNYNLVAADQTAKNAEWAILNYDGGGTSNIYTAVWRRIGYGAKLISDDFRAVFGDTAMPPNVNAVVRPLLEFQASDGQATGSTELQFVDNFYNNSDGVAHVATPHPANYFFWGCGGATYYGSNDDTASTVDALFASGLPNTGYAAMTQADTALARVYGMKRVAYEGGWSVYNGTNGYTDTAGTAAALAKFDARATTAQMAAHQLVQQAGGDLDIFYTSSSWAPTYIWGLTDEVFNLTTPLFQAVTGIDSATAPAVTFGNPISATAPTTLAYGSQFIADSTYNSGLPNNGTLGWVPLIATTGDYQVNLNISTTSAGRFVQVLIDGVFVGGGPIAVPYSTSPPSIVVGTYHLAAGQHGLAIEGQYTSGNTYSGNSCGFTSFVLTPVPTLQITGQPQARTATLATATSFTVTATGNNLTYQWALNGVALAGQTSATLQLPSVAQLQAGAYTVTVTNSTGSVVSAPAILTVQATYAQWAALRFTALQQQNTAEIQPGATPFSDNVPNQFKYLFDIDPSRTMSTTDRQALALIGVLPATGKPQYVTLTFRQNSLTTAAFVLSQISSDLILWQAGPAPVQLKIDTATGDPIMQVKIPVSSTTPFVRLQVPGD